MKTDLELLKQSGAQLIAIERERQISKEGWTPDHDDQHTWGDLADAGGCYVCVASAQLSGSSKEEWPVEMFNGFNDSVLQWPFEDEAYKPSDDPLRNLVKAGALIAAEIDRIIRQRIDGTPEGRPAGTEGGEG